MRHKCLTPWHDPENGNVDNEIAWTEAHIARELDYIKRQQAYLRSLYNIRDWWERFLGYCQTGK